MAKHEITEIGKGAPRSLKFGLIVAISILWADVLRSFLNSVLNSVFNIQVVILDQFLVALVATIFGLLVIAGYRKIFYKLKKIKF